MEGEHCRGAPRGSRAPNAQGRKHLEMVASREETENARSEDTKGATADRPPEVPDLHRVSQRPPPQSHRDPTLNEEREPLEV